MSIGTMPLRRWFAKSAPKPKGWLTPEEDALVPPRDLWIGPDDPISHYYRWAWEYLAYLTLLAGLQRTSAILELGCGHGRTARGLLDYMRSPGRYVGLDVDGPRILDAQRRLQARWPNFEFIRADVFNRQYNPTGRQPAQDYRFPFEDHSFDVIYAASLFTHLIPAVVGNYFRECGRVLKPTGCCLFSVLLLDHYRGPGTTISPMYDFDHAFEGRSDVAVRDPRLPDEAISYRLDLLREMASASQLVVERMIPGLWSQATEWAANEHDLILLRPA
jgi:SAM-dependent methyltransferase